MSQLKSQIKINYVKFYQAVRVVKEITFLESEYYNIVLYPETGLLSITDKSRPNVTIFTTVANVCYMAPFEHENYLQSKESIPLKKEQEEIITHAKLEQNESIKDPSRIGKKKN